MKNIIVLINLLLCVEYIQAQTTDNVKLYADKNISSITYAMNHPLHAWTANNKEVTSVILMSPNKKTITKVAVSVKIADFDSQNANRDSHTIEVTEAIKYPTITFSSDLITQNGEKLNVIGELSFHGVKQKILFEAIQKNINNKTEVWGAFSINMSDYKVQPPSLMGMDTDDEIKINFLMIY